MFHRKGRKLENEQLKVNIEVKFCFIEKADYKNF